MAREIKHGVQIGTTPDVQSEEHILGKLNEERAVAISLTPHHDFFQQCVADIVTEHCVGTDARVIELGTGTGASTETVLKANSSIRIVGVDSSKKRLERAKVRLQSDSDRVELINQDFEAFASTIPENSIDCIFTAFSLHNLPLEQRHSVLMTIASKLKHGGVFVDGDKHGFENPDVNQTIFNQQISLIRNNFSTQPEMRDLWEDHYREDFEIDEPREAYKRFLESIGFEVSFRLEYGLEVVVEGKKI